MSSSADTSFTSRYQATAGTLIASPLAVSTPRTIWSSGTFLLGLAESVVEGDAHLEE